MKQKYKRLIISLLLPQLSGFFGTFFTVSSIPNWYEALIKPSFTPPNWLFGPMWVMLYFLMGISIYLIWQRIDKNKKAKIAFKIFWVHLVLNAIWTPIFFGLNNIILSLVVIVLIWLMILVMIIKFYSINKLASVLLVPYLGWTSLATALNYYIWILN